MADNVRTAAPHRRNQPAGSTDSPRGHIALFRSEAAGVAIVLLVVAAILVAAGWRQWFAYDEWSFIVDRQAWPPLELLRPHNEHLHALPLALYRLTYAIVGLHTYLPYQAQLIATHLLVSYLVYRVLRVSDVDHHAAIGVMLLVGVMGTGYEILLWAIQTALAGSMAFFLAALLVVLRRQDGRADAVAAALLVGSLLCSGAGVSAVAGIAVVRLVQRRNLVAPLRVMAVPTLLYVAWYLSFGREGISASAPDVLASAVRAPLFVGAALSNAAAGAFAIPRIIGPILVVAFGVALVAAMRARRVPPVAAGSLAMLVVLHLTTALLRGHLGLGAATASRYVYIGVVLYAVGVPPLVLALVRGRHRGRATAVIVALALLGAAGNTYALFGAAAVEAAREQELRRRVESSASLIVHDGVDVIDHARVHRNWAPALSVAALRDLIAAGSVTTPPTSSFTPDEISASLSAIQTAIRRTDELTGPYASLTSVAAQDALDLQAGEHGCAVLRADGSGTVAAVFAFAAGGEIGVVATTGGSLRVYRSATMEFPIAAFVSEEAEGGVPYEIDLAAPATATAFMKLEVEGTGDVTVCAEGLDSAVAPPAGPQ